MKEDPYSKLKNIFNVEVISIQCCDVLLLVNASSV
jgi:hypothetical protein